MPPRFPAGGLPPLEVETVVDAPVDAVWSVLSDLRRMGERSPETVRMFVSDAPRVGTRSVNVNRRAAFWWPTTARITQWKPPTHDGSAALAFHVWPTDVEWSYELRPEGAGTRVAVILPVHVRPAVRAASEPAPPPEPEPVARRLKVLIVDDEPLVRRVLSLVLYRDHDIEAVENGEDALAMLETRPFDVVLCDVMMPGMNGMEVFEQVRRRRPGFERRIVFVTGGAFVPRLVEFLETCDNLQLLKPFDVPQIFTAVLAAADR